MRVLRSLLAAGLVCLFGIAGCGGDSSDQGADLSQLTPAEICKQKCDLQAATQCMNIPANYAADCALLCEAKYQKFPNCTAQAHATDECAIQRIHYSCEAGMLTLTPSGACAEPGSACFACTGGDLLGCS